MTAAQGMFTEAQLECAVVELFAQQGYMPVDGDTLDRTHRDILIEEDLRAFLAVRYPDLTATEMQMAVNQLRLIPAAPLYAGNRAAHRLVTEGFDLVREDAARVALHVDFIDWEDTARNTFRVVRQFSVEDRALRRPDLLLFVNGIPVTILELKSAVRADATIYDAWAQITTRYVRDIPRLLRYTFLAVISDGVNTRMGSIFTPYAFFYAWSRVQEDDAGRHAVGTLGTMVEGAFAAARLLMILRDFIFYPDDGARETAIVCRYPQFFAARRMFDSIRAHLRPHGDGKGGTYFGATGCGKTYTMLFLARLLALRDRETLRNPTIVLIADREDLDTQMAELFVTARSYLHEQDVRSIESRADLRKTLHDRPSGGVYVTTIQKFCEDTGLLSARTNVIVISDEAHRSQAGVGAKLRQTDAGVHTVYGFGYYLRQSFPQATYCGFTGTPVEETVAVFGPVVDRYTMQQSGADGITVRLAYEPRLARVMLSDAEVQRIADYYARCAEEGSTPEQIEESARAMVRMRAILAHPDRIARLARDMVLHYEALCAEKPAVVQKAMIVCADRAIAFAVLQEIGRIRPDWTVSRRAADEGALTPQELERLSPLPLVNLVATQGANDPKELYELCGSREYRRMLDRQFKNPQSNFRVAVVVDMWITGFDVPALAVMYIDKPLQRHTLIQTISRVNRVYAGKDQGLIVDYVGIRRNMLAALKAYGGEEDSPVDEHAASLLIFRDALAQLDALMAAFDAADFYHGAPLARLMTLHAAAEFVQLRKERQTQFMGLTRRLKGAYGIVFPSGALSAAETARAQLYLAIRALLWKQTKGAAPDAETMNRTVEGMVRDAISCTGIEQIVNHHGAEMLDGAELRAALSQIPLPITKFNALLQLMRRAISAYAQTNGVQAAAFEARLRALVERYNTRDKLVFTSAAAAQFVDDLSGRVIDLMEELQMQRTEAVRLGGSAEEQAFFDILVAVRDAHGFPYADEKCRTLACAIKEMVDAQTQFVDWSQRADVKAEMNVKMTVLLYQHGYPPQWREEVFDQVMAQAVRTRQAAAVGSARYQYDAAAGAARRAAEQVEGLR